MFFLLVYGRVHNTTRFYATASQSIIKGERSNSTNSMLDHYSGNIKTVGQLIGAASSFMPDKDIYHHVEAGDKWTYKEAHVGFYITVSYSLYLFYFLLLESYYSYFKRFT